MSCWVRRSGTTRMPFCSTAFSSILVAFVDDYRILGKRACGAAGRELAQCTFVETG